MRAADQQVVRSLELFADMRAAHFRTLMNAALLQSFPPRVLLIREGDLPDFLHVLVEGSVEQFAEHAVGRRRSKCWCPRPLSFWPR